ncbi:MAG: protein-disulfide reductase DsbD family protein [Paludibacter sp.]
MNLAARFLTLLLVLLGAMTPAVAQQSSASSGLASLLQSNDEFLHPDQAFKLSAEAAGPDQIRVTWEIAQDYYLYRKRMGFSTETAGTSLGEAQFPQGDIKNDEFFGEMEVYHQQVTALVPVTRSAGPAHTRGADRSKYQGCAEAGLCYNPSTKVIDVELPASNGAGTITGKASSTESGSGMVSEQDRLAGLIRDGNLLAVLGTFFGLGLLLSFTPCVLPMIPILSGIIVGQGDKATPARGFSLAFTYVQGMALTYAAAAVAFVLAFQQAPQAFFQKPWIVGSFAASVRHSGVCHVRQLHPAAAQRAANPTDRCQQPAERRHLCRHLHHGRAVGPDCHCLRSAGHDRRAVSHQSDRPDRSRRRCPVRDGAGHGRAPAAGGRLGRQLLPKSGAWMDVVKSLFGVMFLGLAIYMLSSLLPERA